MRTSIRDKNSAGAWLHDPWRFSDRTARLSNLILRGRPPADVPSPRSSNTDSPQSSAALPFASCAGSNSQLPTPVPGPAAAEVQAWTPCSCWTTGCFQTGKGCKGRRQGWLTNKPACACLGVSACTVHEISAFSRASLALVIKYVLRRTSLSWVRISMQSVCTRK
jgi:hypothetical protein